MSLTSPGFLGLALVFIVLLRTLPGGTPRKAVLLVFSAAFLCTFVTGPLALVPLLAFVLLGYGAIMLAEKYGAAVAGRGLALGFLVAVLVAAFIWLKRYPIVSAIPTFGFAFTVVGLSYILFRILHVLIDVAQGSLKRPKLLDYLNYVLFFLSLLSGPIQRFEDFAPQAEIRPPTPDWRDVDRAAKRVVLGYTMVVVLATIATNFVGMIKPLFAAALVDGHILASTWLLALLVSTYLLNLFVNFAGYMEIVIGIGGLAGIVLPENFDHPFVARNFLDLWARWHITLSNWFKFYLFNALLKALSTRFGTRSNTPYLGALAFFVTFAVMGVWHGTTSIFLIYGLFLGAGVTINRLWQIWAPKWWGKPAYKTLTGKRWYYEVSRAATLSYFAIALSSFWIDIPTARALVAPRGLAVLMLAFALLTGFGTIAGWAWDVACERLRTPSAPDHSHDHPAPVWLRLRLLVVPIARLFAICCALSAACLFMAGFLAGSSTVHSAGVIVLAAVFITAIGMACGVVEPAIQRFVRAFALPCQSGVAAAWLGVRTFILANLAFILASSIPEFIYKAF